MKFFCGISIFLTSIILSCNARIDSEGPSQNSNVDLEKHENDNLNYWAGQILFGEMDSISQYLGKEYSKPGRSLAKLLPRLINATYPIQEEWAPEPLLEFINSLPSPLHQAIGYSEVWKQMQERNDVDDNKQVSMLLWRIKDVYLNEENTDEGSKQILLALIFTFPHSIRSLVTDENGGLYIANQLRPLYWLYGSAHGNVYTYPAMNYESNPKNQYWKAYAVDKGRYFLLENNQNENSLYEDGKNHVYGGKMHMREHNMHWAVIPTNNGRNVYFKNRKTGNFMSGGHLVKCRSSKSGKCSTVKTVETKGGMGEEWRIVDTQ